MKKYEIYLPLKYNDGKDVEAAKIKQIREELIARFGALTVSSLSAPYQGSWKYGGVEFIDDIIKFEIITMGDRKTEAFSSVSSPPEEASPADRYSDNSSGHSNHLMLRLRGCANNLPTYW